MSTESETQPRTWHDRLFKEFLHRYLPDFLTIFFPAEAARLDFSTLTFPGQELIVNLPGQPRAIRETLEGLRDAQGATIVQGVFAAVPYCIDLIGGPYIETDETMVKAFRPKSAVRQKPASA